MIQGLVSVAAGASASALDPSLGAAVAFFSAIMLLDFFDVSLPRGDSAGVAGPLVGAGVVVLGPLYAGALALASAALSHAARRGTDSPFRLASVLASRTVAVTVATLAAALLKPFGIVALFIAVPAAYLAADLASDQAVVSLVSHRPFLRLLRGSFESQVPILAAQWSASVLLLITYGHMGRWSLIPVAALLLLVRQSYALFLDVQETYRATVQTLVEAAESQDDRRVGHAERAAAVSRSIAVKMGLPPREVERIGYAALLHDLGELAGGANKAEGGRRRRPSSADVVEGVEFFASIEPVLRLCDGGSVRPDTREQDLQAALVVALGTDIDAGYHPSVLAAHDGGSVDALATSVSPALKARVVGAALSLGYRVPAVA